MKYNSKELEKEGYILLEEIADKGLSDKRLQVKASIYALKKTMLDLYNEGLEFNEMDQLITNLELNVISEEFDCESCIKKIDEFNTESIPKWMAQQMIKMKNL